jgi:hypothetical protein
MSGQGHFRGSDQSSELLHQVFQMTRRKGMVIPRFWYGAEERGPLFERARFSFHLLRSRSADENYEKKGLDYPYGYVR